MKTENIHLMITPLCDRTCKYCCNNSYTLNDIPIITDEELRICKNLFLTGGEPLMFCNVPSIARYYKKHYPNIEKIYCYTNALPLHNFLHNVENLKHIDIIDGWNISIKNHNDLVAFFQIVYSHRQLIDNKNSRLYIMYDYKGDYCNDSFEKCLVTIKNLNIINRKWQENFKPANDSIFRKMM